MLLEEQNAGRKPDPQSLGLIGCLCNMIPHTRESTQSTLALLVALQLLKTITSVQSEETLKASLCTEFAVNK